MDCHHITICLKVHQLALCTTATTTTVNNDDNNNNNTANDNNNNVIIKLILHSFCIVQLLPFLTRCWVPLVWREFSPHFIYQETVVLLPSI